MRCRIARGRHRHVGGISESVREGETVTCLTLATQSRRPKARAGCLIAIQALSLGLGPQSGPRDLWSARSRERMAAAP